MVKYKELYELEQASHYATEQELQRFKSMYAELFEKRQNHSCESEWEIYANTMKNARDYWKSMYHQSQAIVLRDGIQIEKLEVTVRKLKEYISNGIEFGYIDDREGDYKKLI